MAIAFVSATIDASGTVLTTIWSGVVDSFTFSPGSPDPDPEATLGGTDANPTNPVQTVIPAPGTGNVTIQWDLTPAAQSGETVTFSMDAGEMRDADGNLSPAVAAGAVTNNSTAGPGDVFIGLAWLSQLKAWLKITGTDDDADLTRLLRTASDRVSRHANRDGFGFVAKAHTETFDCERRDALFLRATPVVSVSAVTLIRPDNTESVVDADAYRVNAKTGTLKQVRSGAFLWMSGGPLGSVLPGPFGTPAPMFHGFQGVRVGYVGGYTIQSLPPDLSHAAVMIASDLWNTRGRDLTLRSVSLGDYSESRSTPTEQSEWFQSVIAPYRREAVTV